MPKLGLLAVALTAAAGVYACGGSSSGGGSAASDAGGSDATHPRDGAVEDHAAVDVGTGPEATSGDDAAADAGLACAPPTSRGAACGSCVAANCESAWCDCRADAANIDDGGNSGCVRYVTCAEQCVASDAGTPTDCLQKICAGIPFNPIEEHEGQTLVDCLVAYCAADCVN